MKLHSITCCALLSALGCGGGMSETRPAESASPGIEDESALASEAPVPEPASEEPAFVPRKSGPASLTLEARVRGESVPATVRLLDASGQEVASGSTGQAIEATSGEYTLEIAISDEKSMLDKPTQRRQLTLNPGDSLHETADFPWAMIQLNVKINGRLDKGAEVTLIRNGNEVAKVRSAAPHQAISPGRYEAVVKARGAKIDVKGMLFPEGATESLPVDVHM